MSYMLETKHIIIKWGGGSAVIYEIAVKTKPSQRYGNLKQLQKI